MKIRWTHDSVRFRITPTEMEAILHGKLVRETMPLPGGGSWGAAISPGESSPTHLASEHTEIIVYLAPGDRERLGAPDAEGVYFPGEDGGLRFFIEKDFPCVHPRALEAAEPATETFPAPEGFAERKGVTP